MKWVAIFAKTERQITNHATTGGIFTLGREADE